MHAMVLGFAGYGLLLSSCAALIMLLRVGCLKDILKSPLHILSTSDSLISMITSLILLVNQSVPLTNLEEPLPITGADKIGNQMLLRNLDNEEYYQNETCMRFYRKYNNSWLDDGQDINGMASNCTFQHVLMHYAMFLMPFANAFISLLIYSVQCSRGISCVIKKCSSLAKVSRGGTQSPKFTSATEQPVSDNPDLNFQKRDLHGQEDLNIISKDTKGDRETRETILTISGGNSSPKNLKNNTKITGIGLITQWLVPVLVTAILSFSKTQDMNKVRELNEMECIFKVNFPLESCYKAELLEVDSLINSDRNYSELPVYVGVEDLDTSRLSYPDSGAIDEIVSKVRNVVQSAMNKTCNNSSGLKYYDNFKPWNITRNITFNNLSQKVTNDENKMLEKLADLEQALNNKNQEILRANECGTTNGADSVKANQAALEDVESKLFKDLLESTKKKAASQSSLPIEKIGLQDLIPQGVSTAVPIMGNEDIDATRIDKMPPDILQEQQSQEILNKTSFGNKNEMINAEIQTGKLGKENYADIIKRIRDTVFQVQVKGHVENLRNNYEASNDESRTNRAKIFSLEPGSRKIKEDKIVVEKFLTESEVKRPSQARPNVNSSCFLSTNFLKIHLLILLFVIYFIPVLLSVILQTRALYMCQNVFQQIETASIENYTTAQKPDSNNTTVNKNPSVKSGWFCGESNRATETHLSQGSTSLKNSQDVESPNLTTNAPFQIGGVMETANKDEDLKLDEKKSGYKIVLHEAQSLKTLFSILTKSLMLSILMWTPAFIEILSKVFLCISTPAWLVNSLYLLGVSFGIVKNFVNVNIAKINKNINDQINSKENSIHPSI